MLRSATAGSASATSFGAKFPGNTTCSRTQMHATPSPVLRSAFLLEEDFLRRKCPAGKSGSRADGCFRLRPTAAALNKENALDDVSGAEEDVVLGRLPSRTPSWGHLDVFGHR